MKMCPVPSGPDHSGSPQTSPLLMPTHTHPSCAWTGCRGEGDACLERRIHFDHELIEKEVACRLVEPGERGRPAETLEQRSARVPGAHRSRHEDQAVERQVHARQRVGVAEAGEDLHEPGGLALDGRDERFDARGLLERAPDPGPRRARAPEQAEADTCRDARNRGSALIGRRPAREGFTRDAAAVFEASVRYAEPAHGSRIARTVPAESPYRGGTRLAKA